MFRQAGRGTGADARVTAIRKESTERGRQAAKPHEPGWERWADRLFGRSAPAPAPRLTRNALLGLLGLLAVWRLSILIFSYVWGRMIIATQWPAEIDVMWLWRYSVRWDAGWYLVIASDGYTYFPLFASRVAFFPVFPLLIRGANALLPGSDVLAALLIVHLALVAAVIYIYKLITIDFGEQVARRSVLYLLIYPGAFFFSAVYAESLLLLGFAGALYYARRGNWWVAGLFGMFAGATKLLGLVLIVPLVVELIAQRQVSWRRPWPALAVALTPLGALAYFAYLQAEFGRWDAALQTQEHWYRQTFEPVFFLGLKRIFGDTGALVQYPANTTPLKTAFLMLDTTLLWIFVAAGVVLWLRYRPSYGAFVLAACLIFGMSGVAQSTNRYVAVLFPAFIILGALQSERLRTGIALFLTFGLAMTTYLFIQGYWAG